MTCCLDDRGGPARAVPDRQAGDGPPRTGERPAAGRNVDEALRMVDALQFTEEHGEVCPANWREGQEG